MNKVYTPLSSIYHVALKQAIQDITMCRKSKSYKVSLNHFHNPINGICYIDLSGAVLARRTRLRKNQEPNYDQMDINFLKLLHFLNDIVRGCVNWYYYKININSKIPNYVQNPISLKYDESNFEDWKSNLLKIADWLEKNCIYE